MEIFSAIFDYYVNQSHECWANPFSPRGHSKCQARLWCKEGTPVDGTRSAVTNGLRKKLKELMMDFQGLRQRMMTEYTDSVGRQYYTVTGEYPNEDVIETIISDEDVGEKFLAKAIQEHGRGKVLEQWLRYRTGMMQRKR